MIRQQLFMPLSRLHCQDGIATHLATLLPRLKIRGWHVTVISGIVDTPRGSETAFAAIVDACGKFEIDPRLRIEGRLTPRTLMRQTQCLRGWMRHLGLLREPLTGIVHLQGRGLALPVRLAGRTSVPVVYTIQLSVPAATAHSAWHRVLSGRLLADRAIAISRELRDELTLCHGVVPGRVRLVHHGVDTTYFRPPNDSERAEALGSLGLTGGDFTIGIIARIAPVKRHDTLLDAFAIIRKRGTSATLLIAGTGDAETTAALRQQADRLGIADSVHFLGHRASREVFWACDTAVLPSEREGFPSTICEAMACGVVPVRTPVEGAADQIDDGHNGLFFPVGDYETLAARLQWLIDYPADHRRLAAAAVTKARVKFDADVMTDKTVAVYCELLDGSSQDRARRF